MKARIELYKDGDHMAVVTNAVEESDFWESFCELLGNLITEDLTETPEAPGGFTNYGGDWEFQLRYWLPQATEIVCRLRGYKSADVREERLIVSGWLTPSPSSKRHEIGPELDGFTAAATALTSNGGTS